jgi:hypothetical protein
MQMRSKREKRSLGANVGREKNSLPCAVKKPTTNKRVCRAFHKKCMTNYFFYRALNLWRKTHDKLFFLPCDKSLSCAVYKTHDKESLCRVPERKCTAKMFTHGKSEFSRSDYGLQR